MWNKINGKSFNKVSYRFFRIYNVPSELDSDAGSTDGQDLDDNFQVLKPEEVEITPYKHNVKY